MIGGLSGAEPNGDLTAADRKALTRLVAAIKREGASE